MNDFPELGEGVVSPCSGVRIASDKGMKLRGGSEFQLHVQSLFRDIPIGCEAGWNYGVDIDAVAKTEFSALAGNRT